MDRNETKKNPEGGSVLGYQASPQEQKRWEECSIEEKIERLRVASLQRQYTLEALQNLITRSLRVNDLLEQHTHDMQGRVVVAVGDVDRRGIPMVDRSKPSFDPLA